MVSDRLNEYMKLGSTRVLLISLTSTVMLTTESETIQVRAEVLVSILHAKCFICLSPLVHDRETVFWLSFVGANRSRPRKVIPVGRSK